MKPAPAISLIKRSICRCRNALPARPFRGFNRQIQIFEKIFPAGVGKNAGKFYFSLDRAEIGGVGTVLQPRFYRQRVQRRQAGREYA